MKEYIIPVIEVKKGSIATLVVDAIVNPANSFGFMGGGVSLAIKTIGGEKIEEEAIEQAPVQIGDAIFTTGGFLPCKKVIHAPTMHNPVEKTDVDKVASALEAALRLADDNKIKSIGIPAMGTGVGTVPKKDAAKAMIKVIKQLKYVSIQKIVLVAFSDDMFKAFESELKKK